VSEPTTTAWDLLEIAPDLVAWHIEDERIGGHTSASYALRADDGGTVLIDPLPLAEDALGRLEPVAAIVLTAATHQRSAWRYRERFDVPVWLPSGSRETEEPADHEYADGDTLPAGLLAIRTPGPELPHYSLYLERTPCVVFSPDLVMREADGELAFVPAEFHEDPVETRRSVERTLDLDFEILCLAHGLPLTDNPKAALRELLDRSA
jgi:glyoxylase-like metal-dependent hydrolase (beta-lactamase superfamily II)